MFNVLDGWLEMTWSQAETDIYEQALANVADNNKALARMYLKANKEISDKLKQFLLTIDPSWSAQYQAKRLSDIFKEINKRLSVLSKLTEKQIEEAYLQQYKAVLDSYSFELGKYFDLLPLEVVSNKMIMDTLNSVKITDYSFRDYSGYARKVLQDDLKEQISISILEGENPNMLAKRLKEVFGDAIARHTATARTEVLKAFSLSQEEAISQAEDLGITFKFKWSGNNDGRERPAHIALNGKYATKEDDGKSYFYGQGCKGTSPRLFTGNKSAGMNINCRCRRMSIPQTI